MPNLLSLCRALILALGLAFVVPAVAGAARPVDTSAAAVPAPATMPVAPSTPGTKVFTPRTRTMFNNPLGSANAQRRLFRYLIRATDAVPSSGTIRWAVYSFADKAVADALIRAHRRGVDVKLLSAGRNVYPPMKRMQAELGKNPRSSSFAIVCDQSCRGKAGEMHAKFFSFSKVGDAKHVTMVGSNNLTRHNAEDQWSDLYTVVGDRAYYQTFGHWYTSAKLDTPVRDPYIYRAIGGNKVMITPVALDDHRDPLTAALDSVTCQTRAGDIDPGAAQPNAMVPSRLLFAQHAWNGPRGKRLAQQVAGLLRAGCRVRVFYGEGVGPAVRNILTSAGAKMRKGTHAGVLTHQKLLIVNGHTGHRLDTVRVWTGSHNWTTLALRRDDVIVKIDDQDVGQQYLKGFSRMWREG